MDADDPQLLERAARDREAFAYFYRSTVEGIVRYFQARVFESETAADLTAETYAQLLSGVHRYRAERGEPSSYLYGIARHQLASFYRQDHIGRRFRRKLRMETRLEWDGGIDNLAEEIDREIAGQRAAEGLEKLSSGLRDAVRLRVIQQLPYTEVARELGCSEGAARVRVSRGLAMLHETVETEQEW